MKIKFKGMQTTTEAADSVEGMLKLFKERYGIQHFDEVTLEMTLLNNLGEEVEIIDASTDEVFDVFEVYKTAGYKKPRLKLVVDNTVHH